jgi:transposase
MKVAQVELAMVYKFLACDRDQGFLLPPDLRDWLPADHLAWFLLDVVDQLDLGPFLAAYRADRHGRAADDPKMLLGVLLYAYCTGVRSSRQIERRCVRVRRTGASGVTARRDGHVFSAVCRAPSQSAFHREDRRPRR